MVITLRQDGSNDRRRKGTRRGKLTAEQFLEKFENVTPSSDDNQFKATCPAHDDNTASLSIRIDGEKALLKCHAGCKTEDVVKAVGLTMSDLSLAPSTTKSMKLKKQRQPSGAKASPTTSGTIIETYDYHDEDGDLVYQVCRMQPKSFRQRRPDGNGGWIWNLKGINRLLYRLPELMASDKRTTVFLCEGETDVGTLTDQGLVATTNSGGAKKWCDEFNESLRGREVVILPDNDDPGWKHATQIAAALTGIAKSVKVLQLDGLPEKGDVSDWFEQGHRASELKQLAANTDEWTPDEEEMEFQPFPTHLLPAPIARFVREAAKSLGCNEAFLAVPLLSVFAAAIGNSRRIQLKKGWCEPSVLWAAIVGDSGTLKSPALDLLLEPLHRRQQEAAEKHKKRMEKHEQQSAKYEKVVKKASSLSEVAIAQKFSVDEFIKPETPVLARYLCGDTTIEALSLLLQDQPRGLLMFRDELSGWLAGFDAYKPSRGADEAHWLSMHRAGALTVDRKTDRMLICVPMAAVSVTGGIQPNILARVLESRHFESGLAARLLFAYPPKPIRRWTDEEISDEAKASYESVIERLYGLRPGLEEGVRDVPIYVPLSESGRDALVKFVNEHAQEQFLIAGDPAAAWSKLEGYAARLALIIHCVRVVSGDESLESVDTIDASSIQAGVAIARWFGREALRVYLIVRPDEAVEKASLVQELLAIIRRRGGRITARVLATNSRRFGKSVDEAEVWLRQLVKLGLATSEVVKRKGRPRTDYVLHGGGVYERSKT